MTNTQQFNAAMSGAASTLSQLGSLDFATASTDLLQKVAFDLNAISAAIEAEVANRMGRGVDFG